MVEKNLPVVAWGMRAYASLQKTYYKIAEDSPKNAEKVRDGILKITRSLPQNPEKYPLDKFKKNNKGNYRAFEKYSYRIAYRHSDKEIKVIRIRHVKQEPKGY